MIARARRRTATLAAVALATLVSTTGCNVLLTVLSTRYETSLGAGEVKGTAVFVDEDGATRSAAFAEVSVAGTGRVRRADAFGRFSIPGLLPGVWLLTIRQDNDGDGWPERLRAVPVSISLEGHAPGPGLPSEERVIGVSLGEVTLEPTSRVEGRAELSDGSDVPPNQVLRVVAVRRAPVGDDEGAVRSTGDIEAVTAADSAAAFVLSGVGPGEVLLFPMLHDVIGGIVGPAVAVGAPVTATIGEPGTVDVGTLRVDPGANGGSRRISVRVAPEAGQLASWWMVFAPPGSDPPPCSDECPPTLPNDLADSEVFAPCASDREAQLDAPHGLWDVHVCADGGRLGVLYGRAVGPPGEDDPEIESWGSVLVTGGDPCNGFRRSTREDQGECEVGGAGCEEGEVCRPVSVPTGNPLTESVDTFAQSTAGRCYVPVSDCDGDGQAALPPALGNEGIWGDCAAACEADALGRGVGGKVCDVGGVLYDCDDDGDAQSDTTEPDCYGPGRGTDIDGDGNCSARDSFPQCAADNAVDCVAGEDDVTPRREIFEPTGDGDGDGDVIGDGDGDGDFDGAGFDASFGEPLSTGGIEIAAEGSVRFNDGQAFELGTAGNEEEFLVVVGSIESGPDSEPGPYLWIRRANGTPAATWPFPGEAGAATSVWVEHTPTLANIYIAGYQLGGGDPQMKVWALTYDWADQMLSPASGGELGGPEWSNPDPDQVASLAYDIARTEPLSSETGLVVAGFVRGASETRSVAVGLSAAPTSFTRSTPLWTSTESEYGVRQIVTPYGAAAEGEFPRTADWVAFLGNAELDGDAESHPAFFATDAEGASLPPFEGGPKVGPDLEELGATARWLEVGRTVAVLLISAQDLQVFDDVVYDTDPIEVVDFAAVGEGLVVSDFAVLSPQKLLVVGTVGDDLTLRLWDRNEGAFDPDYGVGGQLNDAEDNPRPLADGESVARVVPSPSGDDVYVLGGKDRDGFTTGLIWRVRGPGTQGSIASCDCATDQACLSGNVCSGCVSEPECTAGLICDGADGTCLDPSAILCSPVGDSPDCPAGYVCVASGQENSCDLECDHADCVGAEEVCERRPTGGNFNLCEDPAVATGWCPNVAASGATRDVDGPLVLEAFFIDVPAGNFLCLDQLFTYGVEVSMPNGPYMDPADLQTSGVDLYDEFGGLLNDSGDPFDEPTVTVVGENQYIFEFQLCELMGGETWGVRVTDSTGLSSQVGCVTNGGGAD